MRSVTVLQTRCAFRRRRASRSTNAIRSTSRVSGDRRPPTERSLGTHRATTATDLHTARIAIVREGVEMPSGPRPRISTKRGLAEPCHLCDGGDGALPELRAVTGPTPHSRSIGNPCRNASSPSAGTTSRPSGFATPLATFARNFVRGHANRDADPDPLEHIATQVHRDLGRRAGDPAQPADVQERLVDGQPLHERRGVVEDREHRLARLAVGLHPRPDDDRVRAQAASPASRPSAFARRRPWPRSWQRARRRPRRSQGGRADAGSSRCSTDA